jgi:periplasmic divalent cation tolerance protein
MSKKEVTLTQVWEIRTTLPNEEAAISMAKQLVQSKLAACVHVVGPIRSIYCWKNALQTELEWTLTIKTLENLLERCTELIAKLHSYEVPEIISNPIHKVGAEYHQWLQNELEVPTGVIKTEPMALATGVDFTTACPIAPEDSAYGSGEIASSSPQTANAPSEAQKEPWHIRLQMMGSGAVKRGCLQLPSENMGVHCDKWSLPNGAGPLKVSFEQLADEMTPWPDMHFEMDGSFVWVSSERDNAGAPLWQVDGMIYDRNDRVQYVELKGICNKKAWIELVSVFDPTCADSAVSDPLVVYLVKESTWILESDFRKTLT